MKRSSEQPSQCKDIRLHLDAYLDSELADPSLHRMVQQHIENCSSCRLEIEALKAIHDQLKAMPLLTASEDLYERVRSLARESIEARSENTSDRPSRRSLMIAGMIAASLVLFSALGIERWTARNTLGEPDSADRADLVAFVDDYVAYVQSENTPVIETNDPETMEGWFSSRLEFAPKLPRWPWAKLTTGRLCFIHGQRVARVEYSAEDFALTLFVQPLTENDSAGDNKNRQTGPMKVQTLRGFEVACWQDSGLDYVLVGPSSSGLLFTKIGKRVDEK